jgi:hypothetical protein
LSPATEQKVIDFISAHELPSGADRSVHFQYQRQTEASHKQTTSNTSGGGGGGGGGGGSGGENPATAKETISADVPSGDLDTLNKLQEQLKELGFANSPMSQMVTQQMGGPKGGHQVQFAMEGHHHRHIKTTTNSYQGSGTEAPLDQTQKQFQQQVQHLTGTGGDLATHPQTGKIALV